MLARRGFVDLAGLGDFIHALQWLLAQQTNDLDPAMIAQRGRHPRPSAIMRTHKGIMAIVGKFANCPFLVLPSRPNPIK
jgi:hypothetical protein